MIWTCPCGCRVDDPSNGASGMTCAECMAKGGAPVAVAPMGLDLDALEAAARAATPGPWRVVDRSGEDGSPMYDDEAFVAFGPEEYEGHQHDSTVLTGANARFIAAASPNVILSLVARLRAAEALINEAGLGDGFEWWGDAAPELYEPRAAWLALRGTP